MKKTFIFLLFAIITLGNVFPQTPLCNPSEETSVPNYDPTDAHINIVGDDGDKFIAYYSSYTYNGRRAKFPRHNISIYDKKTNKMENHAVNVPAEYRGLFAYGVGDNIFALYYQDTKKEGQKLITAMVPKNGGEAECRTRLSLPVDKRSYTKDLTAVSLDGSKHALVSYIINNNNKVSEMHVFSFDEKGGEVLHKVISPEIYGGNFSLEDVVVNNSGEVALLLLTGEVRMNDLVSTAVQVVVCSAEGTESIGVPFEDGIINSMKMCALKNGNYFIGGYYTSPKSKTTDAFFHCFVDAKTREFSSVKVREFSKEQVAPQEFTDISILLAYKTKCCFLQQLEDGSIIMIGNHFGKYHVYAETDSHDRLHVGNIVYQHFASDGEVLATPMLKNHQIVAEKFYSDFAVNGLYINFVDKHLSFSPFVSKNDVYIMYNESKANFDSGKGAATYDGPFKKQEYCTVMAKLTDAGPEKQLVMLQDSKKRQFCGVNYFDGKNVYFTVDGSGTFMHHFTLP